VIEQAKGIIMAQSHCGGAQAFDMLRRASQRSNVPVRELAAQIVAKTVQVSPKPVKHLPGLDIVMSPPGESSRYQAWQLCDPAADDVDPAPRQKSCHWSRKLSVIPLRPSRQFGPRVP
jgi:hypothetical protein